MKKRKISPEETKARLIDAGLHLFGIKGYEATRTRELADRAKVNQAAIPYHFGGKEGLYKAVAHAVVARMTKDLSGQVVTVQAELMAGDMPRERAGRLLIGLLHAFLDRVVLAEDIADRSRFIMREYSSPGAGFEIIYDGMLERMHKLLCALVGRVVGGDPTSQPVIIRTHALFGTAVGMVLARALLQRRLGWDEYTIDNMNEIKIIVSDVVTNALRLDEFENGEEAV